MVETQHIYIATEISWDLEMNSQSHGGQIHIISPLIGEYNSCDQGPPRDPNMCSAGLQLIYNTRRKMDGATLTLHKSPREHMENRSEIVGVGGICPGK